MSNRPKLQKARISDGLKECIPPAYTEWIAREFLKANKPGERICEPSAGSKYAPTDGSGGH